MEDALYEIASKFRFVGLSLTGAGCVRADGGRRMLWAENETGLMALVATHLASKKLAQSNGENALKYWRTDFIVNNAREIAWQITPAHSRVMSLISISPHQELRRTSLDIAPVAGCIAPRLRPVSICVRRVRDQMGF